MPPGVQPAEPAVSDKPKRCWYQLSLRTAFALMAMVACFFAGWKARDIAAYAPPETINVTGVVLGIKEDVYELSVGSDDAVAVRTKFSVFRSGKKLGEIVVLDTSPDRCIGLLRTPQSSWTSLWRQTTPAVIQKGDQVSATISQDQVREMRKYDAHPIEAISLKSLHP